MDICLGRFDPGLDPHMFRLEYQIQDDLKSFHLVQLMHSTSYFGYLDHFFRLIYARSRNNVYRLCVKPKIRTIKMGPAPNSPRLHPESNQSVSLSKSLKVSQRNEWFKS